MVRPPAVETAGALAVHHQFPVVLQLRAAGATHREIGLALGRSREWVSRLFGCARDLGVAVPPRPTGDTAALAAGRRLRAALQRHAAERLEAEVAGRAAARQTALAIALALGISEDRVRRILTRRRAAGAAIPRSARSGARGRPLRDNDSREVF